MQYLTAIQKHTRCFLSTLLYEHIHHTINNILVHSYIVARKFVELFILYRKKLFFLFSYKYEMRKKYNGPIHFDING